MWEEYKATAPAPAPAAATTVESDDEGTSDVEDSSSMSDASDVTSDLDLASVSSGSTSSVVTKSHDVSDPASSSSSSSSSSSDSGVEGGAGNGNGLSAADAYILEQGWVPDAQSLHSFKSSRKYETKYLPLIEEALAKASKVAAASAAPTLEQAVNAVILERNPTLSAEDLDSYKTSRGYLKKKDEIEQEAQKRLAAPAPVATTTPEEEAKDAAYEKALVEVILEQNPTLTMSDVETYKTSRAFKKKRAQYEEEVNTRLGIAPEEAPSAVAAAAVAASAVPTKHETEKQRIEKVRRERLEAEYGGSYGETTCDAILLTNIPSSWVCGELESLETSLGALRTMIEKTSGDAGSSRELSALQAKLRKISGEHTSLLKKKKTLLDNLKKTAGLGDELKGLKSIRSICVGEGHFVGAAMLRYDNAGTAAAAYTVMRAKQINPSHAAHPVCTFATSKGVPLSASLLRPPSIPDTHADGEFAPYLLAPPPDQKNEKPKRKFPDRGGKGEGGKGGKGSKGGGEEHSWWEGEFSAKKQKMTEGESSAVTFEIHPAEQEAKAAKAEAKAEKVATSKVCYPLPPPTHTHTHLPFFTSDIRRVSDGENGHHSGVS